MRASSITIAAKNQSFIFKPLSRLWHDDRAPDDLTRKNFLHAVRQFIQRDFVGDLSELRNSKARPISATSPAAPAAGNWPSRYRPA